MAGRIGLHGPNQNSVYFKLRQKSNLTNPSFPYIFVFLNLSKYMDQTFLVFFRELHIFRFNQHKF